jgi:hypothetical protein
VNRRPQRFTPEERLDREDSALPALEAQSLRRRKVGSEVRGQAGRVLEPETEGRLHELAVGLLPDE